MGVMIDTPEGIAAFQKLRLYHALKLEVKCPGLRMSRGSVMNHIKQHYLPECTKRTKAGVLAEFEALLKAEGVITDA